MDLDTAENRATLIGFGDLVHDGVFHVMSPKTGAYNCIAWAMGFTDRWVDYIPDPRNRKKWWPKDVPMDWKPESLIKAFQAIGFELCDDDSTEDGYDKVALYKVAPFHEPISDEDKSEGWTHAARVLTPSVYHSKMGQSFDIYHRSGNVFDGTSYGNIYAYMKRSKREGTDITKEVVQTEPRLSQSNLEIEQIWAIVKASGVRIRQ